MKEPRVGDIWSWEDTEHYLLLQGYRENRFLFVALRLEDGYQFDDMPIMSKGFSWHKVA